MSLWVDWLTVAGLVLLTLGTGAQAWGNLVEFRALWVVINQAAFSESWSHHPIVPPQKIDPEFELHLPELPELPEVTPEEVAEALRHPPITPMWMIRMAAGDNWGVVFAFLGALARVRTEGGKNALQLARLIRQAEIWGLLMLGSALVLMGSVVALIRAY